MIALINRTTFQPFGDKITITRFDGFNERSNDVDLKSLNQRASIELLQKVYDMGRVDALASTGREVSDLRNEIAKQYEPRL